MTKIFIVVGPSGAGKDTLIQGAITHISGLHWVRRVITRAAHGPSEPHEPADSETFEVRRRAGDFAVSWQAHGLSYGIPKSELERSGTVIVNGSRAALDEMLHAMPGAEIINVTAPDHVRAARLAQRNRETSDDIAARRARGEFAWPDGVEVHEIQNDDTPEAGIARLVAILQPVS